jgi:hypothetical protein
MKKIFTLIFSLLLIAQNSYSQDIDLTWGETVASGKRDGYVLLEEAKGGGVFVMRIDKKRRKYIEKYSGDGYSKEFSELINFSLKKNSNKKRDLLSYEEVYVMKDAILVFATQYNKKTDLYTIYAKSYSFDGSEKSSWTKLESISSSKSSRKGSFEVKLSEDKSKLLIIHNVYTKRKELENRYEYSVFDSELIRMYKKEVVLSKESKKDNFNAFGEKLSNDGKVFFFSRNDDDVAVYSLSVDDNETVNSKDLKQYEISLPKKEIIDIGFFKNEKKNYLVVTGFYSDKTNKKNYGISGVVYIRLNAETLKEESIAINPFKKEFLENYVSSRRIRKGKGISTSFDLKTLIFNENGEAVLIAENTYVTQHCTRNQSTGVETCRYVYHFNQLMVIGIDANGEMKYATNVKKYGSSGYPSYGGVSYSVLPAKNGVYIFYNGHYKDFRKGDKKVRSTPSYKRAVLVKAFISDTGELTKESLVRHKEAKLYIMPRYTVLTENKNGLLMLGFYKRIMKIGRLEIN